MPTKVGIGSTIRAIDAAVAAERERLREELDITDKLLAERERVLRAIPECPEHGPGCVPHALEWIERAKQMCLHSTSLNGAKGVRSCKR